MFYNISYLFFKLKLTEPSEKAIQFWVKNSDILKLEYCLKYGNYKTRQLAAQGLEIVGNSSSVPVLLNAIDYNIHNVSIAALNALERISPNNELVISITRKRFSWLKNIRDKEESQKNKAPRKYNIHRWERSSKKSFDRVKEQLKKPIR